MPKLSSKSTAYRNVYEVLFVKELFKFLNNIDPDISQRYVENVEKFEGSIEWEMRSPKSLIASPFPWTSRKTTQPSSSHRWANVNDSWQRHLFLSYPRERHSIRIAVPQVQL